jgi:hypothetical protein
LLELLFIGLLVLEELKWGENVEDRTGEQH